MSLALAYPRLLLNSLEHEISQRNLHGAKVCRGATEHVVAVQHYDFINQQVCGVGSSVAAISVVKHGTVSKRAAAARWLDRKFTCALKFACSWIGCLR